MTKTIKLFLPNEFYEELLYQYEGKDGDLRKLVFGFLKPLGKQGRMSILNKMVQARVIKDGKITMKDVELKDIDLEKTAPKPDPEWIPDKVTKDEVKIYEQSISDRLFDDLVTFSKVFCARLVVYNESLDKKSKDYKDQKAEQPACFEQVIQDNVVGQLSNAIAGNIDTDYDEEFEEMEKAIEDKDKKKNPRKKG